MHSGNNGCFVVCKLFRIGAGLRSRTEDLVLDPGHGGNDPGAISLDGKLTEKSVVLDVALILGKMIKDAYPDVKVIYTRDKDVFIPLTQGPTSPTRTTRTCSFPCTVIPFPRTRPLPAAAKPM